MDLVSVIITSYNAGDYLLEAVQSVRDQTYTNIEIIVSDDGSTDNRTLEILDELKNIVCVIENKNAGVSVARNNGVDVASGKYIIFLDGDDVLGRRYIERVVAAHHENKESIMVYTITQLFGNKQYFRPLGKPSFEKLLVYNDYFVVTCLLLRERFISVGGFNANMIYGIEDWEFFIRYCEEGKKVCRVNEPLFFYRIKKRSRTTNVNSSIKKTLQMRIEILNNNTDKYVNHISSLNKYSLTVDKNRSINRVITKAKFVGSLYLTCYLTKKKVDLFTL